MSPLSCGGMATSLSPSSCATTFSGHLQALCPMDPQVRFSPTGRVSMWIDGLPVSAEGADLGEAEQELVAAARDYAITWVEDLRRFANHEPNWGPVNLILLSDDTQLRSHLFGDD